MYELAMCQLEGGMPEAAAENFTKALTLSPEIGVRPIAAYYLEKIGKPVPPPAKRALAGTASPTAPADALKSNILKTPLIGQPGGTGSPAQGKQAAPPAKSANENGSESFGGLGGLESDGGEGTATP